MVGGVGLPELIVIFLVVFLLFGAKALPEVAKGLAQAIKTFKKEAKNLNDNIELDEVNKMSQESVKQESKSDDFSSDQSRRDWREDLKKA